MLGVRAPPGALAVNARGGDAALDYSVTSRPFSLCAKARMPNPWDRFELLDQTQETWSKTDSALAFENARGMVLTERAASAGVFACDAVFVLPMQE